MTVAVVSAETHTINVGAVSRVSTAGSKLEANIPQNGGHLFDPEETDAKLGDIIKFQFYPHLHSVARAAYEQPCQPIEKTDPLTDEVSFFSGFVPVEDKVGVVVRYSPLKFPILGA